MVIEPNGKITGRTTKFWPEMLPDFIREQVFNFCWNSLEQPPYSEGEWQSVLARMKKMKILETDKDAYNRLMQGIY